MRFVTLQKCLMIFITKKCLMRFVTKKYYVCYAIWHFEKCVMHFVTFKKCVIRFVTFIFWQIKSTLQSLNLAKLIQLILKLCSFLKILINKKDKINARSPITLVICFNRLSTVSHLVPVSWSLLNSTDNFVPGSPRNLIPADLRTLRRQNLRVLCSNISTKSNTIKTDNSLTQGRR